MKEILSRPIVLNPDSFVDQALTPWAGTSIGKNYKSELVEEISGSPIGESWEFSVSDDKLASYDKVSGTTLRECFDFPDLVYGDKLTSKRNEKEDESELLIKLINTSQRLSFQVHPKDSFEGLAKDECGKAEAWLILETEKGAGVYLGFQQGVTKESLSEALSQDHNVEDLLQFVEVEKYDYIRIPETTPHAIGSGLTLIEPQLILPGKKGKTYRISDWGRKYDPQGNLCEVGGEYRELHIDKAMKVIEPSVQSGLDYAKNLIVKPSVREISENCSIYEYSDTVTSEIFILKPHDATDVLAEVVAGFAVITIASGSLTLKDSFGSAVKAVKGETVFLANAVQKVTFSFDSSAEIIAIAPEGSEIIFT